MSTNPRVPPAWLAKHPRASSLYQDYSKHIPVATFLGGFLWDSLTLTRIDSLFDNLLILFYLSVFASLIVLMFRQESGRIRAPRLLKLTPHYLWVLQFVVGGLLSNYVVHYFRSASWTQTSVFFILLVIMLVGNEFLEHRLANKRLLAVLLFFCLFSFLVFFIPIVFAKIGTAITLLAGGISLILTRGVFWAALPKTDDPWWKRNLSITAAVLAAYIVLNLLYFLNLIPPVPLSMKEAGIYHQVRKVRGGYEVQYVEPSWYRFWKRWDDPFHLSKGETVYCYTAIFAPRRIQVPIQHRWSRYLPGRGWRQTDRVQFEIFGGREGGYRGYSLKHALQPGRWRVEVETDRGQILGRIDFQVTAVETDHPKLTSRLIP